MSETMTQLQEERVAKTTAHQIAAADPLTSAWVSANAGSGKTRVLTNRVIRLLLADVQPSRILCLTFTKAAAAEMANRLFEQLGTWTTMPDAQLIEAIEKLEGEVVSRERLIRARRLFARALETPGGLKIQTIHAFAQTVLGRFPLEARVSPHFEVIEDRTSREILAEARWAVIDRAQESPGSTLHKAVEDLTFRLNEQGLDSLLSEVISKRTKIKAYLTGHGGVDGAVRALKQVLGVDGQDEEDFLSEIVDTVMNLKGELLDIAACLEEGGKKDIKLSQTLKQVIAEGSEGEAYETYVSIFLTQKKELRKDLINKKMRETYPHAETLLRQEQERVFEVEQKRIAFEIVSATHHLLTFADFLLEEFSRRKQRRGFLDYSDLIDKTNDLLKDSGNAWVHFKLDGGIDHILVDEAQDTSPDQWSIISALASDFFSGASAYDERTPKVARTMFAVGDEKQSIYSFQGADPKAFEEMRAFFAGQIESADLPFSTLDLILSFRSAPEILAAVDQIYSAPQAAAGLTSSGEPIHHEAYRAGVPGLVELWPTVKVEKPDEEGPWDAPLDRISAQSPRAILAGQIAEKIEGWIASGEPVTDGGDPITPGDILILVQRRDAFVDEMIRALKQKAIPVAGRDRMILTDQIAVMDLMALAEFALLPEDDLTLAVVLKSPFVGLSEEQLFDLAYDREATLWQSLHGAKAPVAVTAKEFLTQVLGRVETMAPFEFFARALGRQNEGELSGRQKLLERLGPEAADPIDEFLNLALSYERVEEPTLQGFLRWVREDVSEIKRDFDHGAQEVRVMTVHGAKGLEGRVVILPDTCAVPSARNDPEIMWSSGTPSALFWRQGTSDTQGQLTKDQRAALAQRRLEEHRRLFYVALTRAEDRLYIAGYESSRGRADDCWYALAERELLPHMSEVADENGELIWRLGEVPKTGNSSAGKPSAKVQPELPSWTQSILPHEAPDTPLIAPSSLEGEEGEVTFEPAVLSPLVATDQNRFKRGLLIHTLLEFLPGLESLANEAAAQEKAAMTYLALPNHELEPAAQIEIWTEVKRILQDDLFAPLFGPGSMAEVPLVGALPGSGLRVNGQIDRLLVEPERILVIDYKTNRPPPQEAEKVAPVYLRQMAAYRALLQSIYPGRQVECALLWTDTPRLMRLPGPLMDQIAAKF
jgi:ATP-dependent helicase/nuclease subunit A